MVTVIEGLGTGESSWAAWTAPAGWPALDVAALGRPLVVAPHPDDEVLGLGGLLSLAGGADIVAVTDGEASHPHADPQTQRELVRRRPGETAAALAELGSGFTVTRLRQPDGAIGEAALTGTLVPLLTPGRSCFVTWRGDGHPDHEAVGRAAAAACAVTGARLWEYPIWMWHWAAPDDARVAWERARRIDLTAAARTAKAAAVSAFTSQIEPIEGVTILPEHVLARFRRPYEVVFA